MPQQEEHLRDYFQLIQKHGFTLCLTILLVLGTALIISLRLPKTYAASTLILLVQPSATSSLPSANLFQNVLSGGVDRREMETISTRFSTESMLNTAIENLEENGYADAAALFPPVGKLKRVLRAQVNPDSDYITLSVELTEAEGGERNAALLVNQLAKDMQMLRRGDEEMKLSILMVFLENKKRAIEAEIDQDLDALLAFVRDNGSPETWVPTLTNLLDRLARVRENLETNQLQLYATNAHITYLKEQLQNSPQQTQLSETTSYNPVWLFQAEKLFDLESQRIAAEKKVGTTSSELEGLNAQITEIQKKNKETSSITPTVTSGLSAHYTYIQNQLITFVPDLSRYENAVARLKREQNTLETELAKLIEQIPENQIILTEKGAKIQRTNAMAEEIAKRSLEAEILYAESKMPTSRNQIGGIEIVDRATPRKIPVSPQLRFILVIAGITGLVLGVTAALFIEYFNRTAVNLKK
ncbi:MAG: hypothetical protein OXC79_12445 [Candidatus Poribacteria bacterium]|nr:hypothetical protein [Candidatus Poribacteria bacterium]